jgi:uncharacterized protein involved in exopolysaccharide biosynthesis
VEEEYKEVTLADLVRTLFRRKFVLAGVFLLVVLAGVAYTVFQDPEYEAQTSLVALEHGDIIKNWLASRHAGELVAQDLGDPVVKEFFPERWDAGAQQWRGEPPSIQEAGAAIAKTASVRFEASVQRESGFVDRLLTVKVRTSDPVLARDIANAYVDTLEVLRPVLENITRDQRFEEFYRDTGNEQTARAEAEKIARNRNYWLPLDSAGTPKSPVSPNVTLNIALSVVLGLLLAVFAVFFVEWASNYRAQAAPVEAPPEPEKPKRYS